MNMQIVGEETKGEVNRFTVSKHESGYYQVSIPNYEGGEVVNAENFNELAQENERLNALMESRLDKETILRHLNYTEGGALTIAASPPEFVRRYLAQLFVIALDDAENFQTGSFSWKAEDYEMTIQRISGKSTAQVLGELKAENAQLKERLASIDAQ